MIQVEGLTKYYGEHAAVRERREAAQRASSAYASAH